jgi:DNA/RNA-binding domain of Phe-tRNA-synthetase-like protein
VLESAGMTVTFHHRVGRDDLGLGFVIATGLAGGPAPAELEAELGRWIERRQRPLEGVDEQRRQASRDILRNGSYKPTGRGKPASEYLLRAVKEGSFPRVSGPVDANNLVSLAHLVPISVWDVELAGTRELEVRLGRSGESYVFNPSGQVLALDDLVSGCGLYPDGASRPLVTPIKDGLATKIRPASRTIAGCIYFPLASGGIDALQAATGELEHWLRACGSAPRSASGVCPPASSLTLVIE